VPRQNSTGGKHRLGGISKRGNQYSRRLLINGASANGRRTPLIERGSKESASTTSRLNLHYEHAPHLATFR
jgi:transposase